VAERGFGTRYPSAWVCKASPVRFLGYPKYFFQNGLFSGISSEHENNHADTQKWPEFFGIGCYWGSSIDALNVGLSNGIIIHHGAKQSLKLLVCLNRLQDKSRE
jgi:hypothetical protein